MAAGVSCSIGTGSRKNNDLYLFLDRIYFDNLMQATE